MRFHIGNVIEKIRSERGVNQAELASKAGIRANTLGDLENRRKNSKLETLEAVAEALGYSVGELYSELDRSLKSKQPKSDLAVSSSCPEGDPTHDIFHAMLEAVLHSDDQKCIHAVVAVLEAITGGDAPALSGDSALKRKHGPYPPISKSVRKQG
jgi:transcriptional regulator with XRE-family HTH domain